MGDPGIETILAFDESNNGALPEIHIVASSSTIKLGNYQANELRKGKKDHARTIFDALGKRTDVDFHFMVLYPEFIEKIRAMDNGLPDYANKKAIVIMNFLEHLKTGHDVSGYRLLMDGMACRKQLELLSKHGLFRKPECYKGGDEHVPLINIADRIAYAFYDEVILGKQGKGPLASANYEKRIYPSIPQSLDCAKFII